MTLSFHHGAGGEVLRRDKLDILKLPPGLAADGLGDLRIDSASDGLAAAEWVVARVAWWSWEMGVG